MSETRPNRPDHDASGAASPVPLDDDGFAVTMPGTATTDSGRESGETIPVEQKEHRVAAEIPTQILPPSSGASSDVSSFPATLVNPTGIQGSVDHVRSEVKRKSVAVLHTKVGDYEIERELGRGAMGVVYKAKHRQLRRDVALKMILSGRHAGPEQLERFLTEARAVAQLQHPNIVQIFDIGEQDGLPYFSLEYVDGQSLAQQLNKQPQAAEDAGRTIELLARAMQCAHDHGVLHRDLKPANVLLTKEGVPKISDFGLAKKVDDDEAASTRTGTVMGTPSYMAPEQARGLTREVGPAADQYSLGAMLYEMLTGRPPFLAPKAVETILQVIHDEPVPPRQFQPNIPVDLETICLKALQKDPSKRYASCLELAEDARRFREGTPILARPVSTGERLWRWCRRNPRTASLSASVLVLLVLVAVGSTAAAVKISRQQSETERQRQAAVAARSLADEKAAAEVVARHQAEEAQKKADENAKVASGQADLALTTLQKLIYEVQKQLENAPGTQQLKKDLLQTAMAGLKQVAARAESSNSQEATMAAAHMKMGLIFKQLGETEEAFKQFMRCHEIVVARMALKSHSDAAKGNVASSFTVLGEMSQELHRDMATALDYYQKALKLREELYQHPRSGEGQLDPTKVKQGLAEAYTRVGVTVLRLGDPKAALEYFQKATELREELVASFPQNADMLQDLARSYNAVGEVNFRLNDQAGAREYYGRCLDLREKMYQVHLEIPKFKQELGRSCGMLGEIHLRTGDPLAAQPQFLRSLTLGRELVALDEKNVEYQRDLGIAYYRNATLSLRMNEPAVAEEYYRECRKIREALAKSDPENDLRQMELMQVLPRCGEHLQAAELAQRIRSRIAKDPELLFEVARCYAQCVAAAATDQESHDRYVQLAIEALTEAIAQGYKDLVSLQTEPDLDPIREHPAYKALLETIRGNQTASARGEKNQASRRVC